MHELLVYAIYLVPLIILIIVYRRKGRKRTKAAQAEWQEVKAAGLTEPPSLHPLIDPAICIGAVSCAKACPENAIGIIDHKGFFINPSVCIGHGACAAACPSGAIRLVFGTERRGVDIPFVYPSFETNIEGLFIAGELGGMGLIRKAVEQGKQAIAHIKKRRVAGTDYDVIIIGAGPAGISATLGAQEAGLRYLTLEQEDAIGGTALHYPRQKIVMTAPMTLPQIGLVKLTEISKEALIELWEDIAKKTGIKINFSERMDVLRHEDGKFVVSTPKGQYTAGSVLLAIGRRGTPRKLDVPGEEMAKVCYRLVEPSQYQGKHALVVGGGDSALEAALSLAEEPGTTVTLAHRSEVFAGAKPKNRERIKAAEQNGRIKVLMKSKVLQIEKERVLMDHNGHPMEIPSDVVIVCAGGTLPIPMLKEIGIRVETRYGT
ncbi:MAG: 4Fe-4S ferredoxin [Gallionellales bacterium RIFCSPLOWO2_02_FULL_57_47]|nr:MAG: 4Fe-4S ferredoxin [Gallionellales bacterium RIFCSPLOWO2_02_FULL_57_47]OGT17855.1 MAG: 4Fe-4S ferredoxin [Gallionellales bacterium RIFCSPHIGHO2_02_FULL_57_16]